jgi:hypothetical protein
MYTLRRHVLIAIATAAAAAAAAATAAAAVAATTITPAAAPPPLPQSTRELLRHGLPLEGNARPIGIITMEDLFEEIIQSEVRPLLAVSHPQ